MPQSINAQALMENLALTAEDILTEAAEQPIWFMHAARYRIAAMKERAHASIELDIYRSGIARALRSKKDKQGQKVTEGTIKEMVETHSKVKVMWEAYEKALEQEELAKLILEAYRQRRDAIRIIAEAKTYEGVEQSQATAKMMHSKLTKAAHKMLDSQQDEE